MNEILNGKQIKTKTSIERVWLNFKNNISDEIDEWK